MSKTLVYQTNREFDQCAELLRSILNGQKPRRDSPSATVHHGVRKEKQNSSTNSQLKQHAYKSTMTKTSFIKTNPYERRPSYSPHGLAEDPLVSKPRLSPTKSRRHSTRSRSPSQGTRARLISSFPTSKPAGRSTRPRSTNDELPRSSSCSDLSSLKSNLMQQEQARSVLDRLLNYLSRVRLLSQQIRTRSVHTINDAESLFLWNELENQLSSAISFARNDIQFQLSLVPLQSEILELRKQLRTTNIHLHEYDLTRRHDDHRYVHLQKKFDSNQSHCRQLAEHNEQLKSKCQVLQEKIDHLQRNQVLLIQRMTQQNIRSVAQRTDWISTENRFLLREEIIFLKEKLYHVYDDLATVFTHNQRLESNIREQKKQLLNYEQQFEELKHSAQFLIRDLNNRSVEEKVAHFLKNILHGEHERTTPSSFTPHVPATPTKPVRFASSSKSPSGAATTTFRPKSLFKTTSPSKHRGRRSPPADVTRYSSTTIADADSTMTSSSSSSSISLCYPQRKRTNVYNSLPALNKSSNGDAGPPMIHRSKHNDESSAEMDEISNLTSKMFSSADEEQIPIRDTNISTSSSSSRTEQTGFL